MNLNEVSAETIKEIPEEIIKKIKRQINKIERSKDHTYPLRESDIKENKSTFWVNQPVMQIKNNNYEKKHIMSNDELDKLLLNDLILPEKFVLSSINLREEKTLDEVYKLLKKYYMKSYDGNFVFTYSKDFLKWFFLELGCNDEITIGLKVKETNKLVGFLGAIRMKLQIHNKKLDSYYSNFLCLHNKLRNKKASTILIRHLSKLCREKNCNLGVYAARYCVHRPLNLSQIYIRPINYKKLCEVGYCYHDENIKLDSVLLNYKLANKLNNENFVKLEERHIDQCFDLYINYSNKFHFHPIFSKEQFKSMLLSKNFITYVIKNEENEAEDFISFYKTTVSVLNNKKYKTFTVANLAYYSTVNHSLYKLLDNILIVSKQMNFDLFTALDIMENKNIIEIFNFFKSRDTVNYYLYNYNSNQLLSSQVGFINL